MDYGRRQAQNILNNFDDDYDTLRQSSRARDLRALSSVDRVLMNNSAPRARSTRSVSRHYNPVVTLETPSTSHLKAHSRPLSNSNSELARIRRFVVLDRAPSTLYSDAGCITNPPEAPMHSYRRGMRRSSMPPHPMANMDVYYGQGYGQMNGPVSGAAYAPHHHHHCQPHGYSGGYYGRRPVTNHVTFNGCPPGGAHGARPPTHPVSQSVAQQKRRIERRSDSLLDYKLPSADYYLDMKKSLRGVNEKMMQHRLLLDRYAGIDMAAPGTVEDRVSMKYNQLVDRMPEIERFAHRPPTVKPMETCMYYGPRAQVNEVPPVLGTATHNKKLHDKIRKALHSTKGPSFDY